MNNSLNQKISQLIDHDLDCDDALKLLETLQHDQNLENTLKRYAAISHALKSQEVLVIKSDFSARITQEIQREAYHLQPRKQTSNVRYPVHFALAASVAVLAILVASIVKNDAHFNPSNAGVPMAQKSLGQTLTASLPEHHFAQAHDKYPLNKRINDYLQAHNAHLDNELELAPLTSVTHYSPK